MILLLECSLFSCFSFFVKEVFLALLLGVVELGHIFFIPWYPKSANI